MQAESTGEDPDIRTLMPAVVAVGRRHPTMSLGRVRFLFAVLSAHKDGETVDMGMIAKRLGIPYPTAAACVRVLGDGAGETPGLGLVEQRAAGGRGKRKTIVPSAKGLSLLNEIETAVVLADAILASSGKRQGPGEAGLVPA